MVLAVPSVETAVFCNKTPYNKLHGVFFRRTVIRGTKNSADEYSYLLRCDSVGWQIVNFRRKCKQYKRHVSEEIVASIFRVYTGTGSAVTPCRCSVHAKTRNVHP